MTLISWFLDCINNYKYYKKFGLIYIIIIINECNKNYIYIYKLIFNIKNSLFNYTLNNKKISIIHGNFTIYLRLLSYN